jgi:hypothetical protein
MNERDSGTSLERPGQDVRSWQKKLVLPEHLLWATPSAKLLSDITIKDSERKEFSGFSRGWNKSGFTGCRLEVWLQQQYTCLTSMKP